MCSGTVAYVDRMPTCALCSNEARYDAKTLAGPWAYLCGQHFRAHTTGELGTGKGQRLVLRGSASESTTGPMPGQPGSDPVCGAAHLDSGWEDIEHPVSACQEEPCATR